MSEGGAGRGLGRPTRLRLAGAALSVAAAGWLAGLVWFAETMARTMPRAEDRTDAVVVLTGGAGRLAVGVDLLARGHARKLFVSGVSPGVDATKLLRLVNREGRDLECCMALGYAADDTRGNAAETARWMREQGYTSLRLVTANYHMRRALLEFARLMPGIAIVPHPVLPEGFDAERWWRRLGSLRLIVSEYVKYLVALLRPW